MEKAQKPYTDRHQCPQRQVLWAKRGARGKTVIEKTCRTIIADMPMEAFESILPGFAAVALIRRKKGPCGSKRHQRFQLDC